jgi:hypothetical protein
MVSVPTGCTVFLQGVLYPIGVFSVPTGCFVCPQDKCSYRVFSIPTECSVSVRDVQSSYRVLGCLQNAKSSYITFIVTTGSSVPVQAV